MMTFKSIKVATKSKHFIFLLLLCFFVTGCMNVVNGNEQTHPSLFQTNTNSIAHKNPSSLPPIEYQIGQMLLLGFQGTNADHYWVNKLAAHLSEGKASGAILLGHNIGSAKDVKSITHALKQSVFKIRQNNLTYINPLIAIDQEGGFVQRLNSKQGVQNYPNAQSIGSKNPQNPQHINQAYGAYLNMADVLDGFQFNVNFGPVVDVNINPQNPIIGSKKRSYSSDPDIVTTYAKTFIDAHTKKNIITALKHFPGHGSSLKDSHNGFVDISKTWQPNIELKPFQDLINAKKAKMIMAGHVYVKSFDPNGEKLPASLSPYALQSLLRQQMGYNGVIVSDDMDMGAIRQQFSFEESIIRAIKAGNDLLILSNSAKPDVNLPDKVIAFLKRSAENDAELLRRINESYIRIISLKKELGLAR